MTLLDMREITKVPEIGYLFWILQDQKDQAKKYKSANSHGERNSFGYEHVESLNVECSKI